MSYSNGTTHYNLPQTTGTDKRDWSDTNQAFQDVDAALYQATQDTAQAELDIDALEVRMDTAEQNITDNAGDISALDGRLTTAEGTITQHTAQIADVRQDTEDMICAYNEASATSTHSYGIGDYFIYNDVLYRATVSIGVGDTIVPDTNCTTTNVTSELLNIHRITVASAAADGVKTYGQMLSSIFNDTIVSEIINSNDTYTVKLIQVDGSTTAYNLTRKGNLTNKLVIFTSVIANIDGSLNYLCDRQGLGYRLINTTPTPFYISFYEQYPTPGPSITPALGLQDLALTIPSSGVRLDLIKTVV